MTIVGLATDFCVRHTALDALRQGLAVTIDTGGVRGIDEQRTAAVLSELADAGARVR